MLSRLASALLFLVAFSGATLQANASKVNKYVIPYAACCVDGVNKVQFYTFDFKPKLPDQSSGVSLFNIATAMVSDVKELREAFFQNLNDRHRYKSAKNVVRCRIKDKDGSKESEVIFVRVPCECTKDKDGNFFSELSFFKGLLDFSSDDKVQGEISDRISGSWKTCESLFISTTPECEKNTTLTKPESEFLVAIGYGLDLILAKDDVKKCVKELCTYFKNNEPCCDIDLVCGNKKDRINALCEILDYLNKCPGGTFDLKGTMETDDEGIVCANYKGNVTLTHELIVCCNKWKLTAWDDLKWFGEMVPAIIKCYAPAQNDKCTTTPRGNIKCFIKEALESGELTVSCVKAADVAAELPCAVTGSVVKVVFQCKDDAQANVVTLYFQLESLGPIKVDSTGSKGSKK